MKAVITIFISMAFTLMMSACAVPTGTLHLSPATPIAATALIRAATREEKLEKKANLAVRIFVNPDGQGSLVRITSITSLSEHQREHHRLKDHASVRVLPGRYIVDAFCILPGVSIDFVVPMSVVAGNQYLLECMGNTAIQTKIYTRSIPEVVTD